MSRFNDDAHKGERERERDRESERESCSSSSLVVAKCKLVFHFFFASLTPHYRTPFVCQLCLMMMKYKGKETLSLIDCSLRGCSLHNLFGRNLLLPPPLKKIQPDFSYGCLFVLKMCLVLFLRSLSSTISVL